MATFVLIHGAGDVGWYWHLLEAELRARGHDTVAPDLPCDDDAAGLTAYADVVVASIGDRTGLVVVAQSFGGFVAPLVCDRVPVEQLVLVAPMIPEPGEAPADYWANTGYEQEQRISYDDPVALFYPDVPPELAAEAMSRSRDQSEARMGEPAPFEAWPEVPTRVLIGRDDRLFPPAYLRRVARQRLGLTPDEIDGGHTPALSRPHELAEQLETYVLSGYDAELRRHNEALRRAAAVQPHDRVLDIGCGAGRTTRQAARAAWAGSALGVDIAIGRARAEGIENVAFEQADAQTHPFPPGHFDVAISRFGTMFFADPVAAFTNIGRALRPAGRLVMLVWQSHDRNEWSVALGGGPEAFSLADPPKVREVLRAAGFTEVDFTEVAEPVHYGPDVAGALDWVHHFSSTVEAFEGLDPVAAAEAEDHLRRTLTDHLTPDGVQFDSRAWIVTAHRPGEDERPGPA